jgi:hypothetical protein
VVLFQMPTHEIPSPMNSAATAKGWDGADHREVARGQQHPPSVESNVRIRNITLSWRGWRAPTHARESVNGGVFPATVRVKTYGSSVLPVHDEVASVSAGIGVGDVRKTMPFEPRDACADDLEALRMILPPSPPIERVAVCQANIALRRDRPKPLQNHGRGRPPHRPTRVLVGCGVRESEHGCR